MRHISERHLAAAKYLLDGMAAYRALREAGYSHYVSRHFGELLRKSWPLREAIRLETEKRQHKFRPAPVRKRRKYDHRALAQAINNYALLPEDRNARSNRPMRDLYRSERMAEAISEDLPIPKIPKAEPFHLGVPCQNCGRRVSHNALYLDMSGQRVCDRCISGGVSY
jgi:hypothetical protein